MRIALFTSNHLRHKYIAAQIGAGLDLAVIVTEEKNTAIEDSSPYDIEDQRLLSKHFADRSASEQSFFGAYTHFPEEVPHISLGFGELNSTKTLALLEEYKVDYILLFGTSIIKPLILDRYPDKVVNLHLGLSPYYKGSGTNFFPVVNNEFACIGATIHVATVKVDAGGILHQLRPGALYVDDTIHSIGNGLIKEAGAMYPHVVEGYIKGAIQPVPQKKSASAKIYRIKDFTPEAIRKAQKVLAEGGVAEYLEESQVQKGEHPIVEGPV